MRYFIAILCPPLAILLCGRIVTALFSGMLWLICFLGFFLGGFLGWLVLMVHAWLVIADHKRRVAIAVALFCCLCASAIGAEVTPEKAARFQEAWNKEQQRMLREADADLSALLSQRIAGARISKEALNEARTRVNQIKRKHEPLTYPQLTKKNVGGIGVISCLSSRGWVIVDEGDFLTVDTSVTGIGSRDNGATSFAVPIRGFGRFVIRGYDSKMVRDGYYIGAAVVYEVVGTLDGMPLVEPFDVKAAKRLIRQR